MMKKLILIFAIVSFLKMPAINLYPLLDTLGSVSDLFLSKGRLDRRDEQLFQKVALSLGIENRGIKPRNSGLILRLLFGYNHTGGSQICNRIHFNKALLKKLKDEEKKFIMCCELGSHFKNHQWKMLVYSVMVKILQGGVSSRFQPKQLVPEKEFNLLTRKWEDSQYKRVWEKTPSPFWKQYFVEGLWYTPLSIWSLIMAQICQQHVKEADEVAIVQGGADPQNAMTYLKQSYYPNTIDWPLYAKIQNILRRIIRPIMGLPIIKDHCPFLCFQDRITNLKTLKNKPYKNMVHTHDGDI